MIYSATITTDANTAKADAKRTTLHITGGLIWRLEVEFPPGPSGLCHVAVMDGNYQLYPASADDSFHSDGQIIGFDDSYIKSSEPFTLDIVTWNLDSVWPHTIQVRVAMASSDLFMARYLPSMAWENFASMLAEAQAEQEIIRLKQIEQLTREANIM